MPNACNRAPYLPPLPASPADWPANITKLLNMTAAGFDLLFAKAGATGGSLALVYKDRVLLSHGYGHTLARGAGRPVDGDTLFGIGSISKMFTVADALHQQEVSLVFLPLWFKGWSSAIFSFWVNNTEWGIKIDGRGPPLAAGVYAALANKTAWSPTCNLGGEEGLSYSTL